MATRLLIEGRVQGVGFRDFVRREAEARGLRGTVRNLPDGRVEAVVVGPFGKVDALLERVREGPPAADVTAVGLDPVADPDVAGFLILRG